MILSLAQGFGVSVGLISAIGAQNAFVLTQGVRREHHLLVALVCALCDIVLISCGVAGLGSLVASHPNLMRLTAWFGAAFLFCYGLRSFLAALRGQSLGLQKSSKRSKKQIILTVLALTLLNPHVYLDTVVLLGSIAGQFHGIERLWYGIGAVTGSSVWFFALSLGGQILAPLFQRTSTWRILDCIIGITMWSIALGLLLKG